ncbi:hypothetical protein CEUSTIGMA_g4365.t1 [Chlamydomonas eustigma]|uniref:Uncharacterized protein n=1 Tax=Chlamydomonas eustigma TaxID=1157962 RepID=A0A250X1V5_9CHLO|nr:hypothetical protein CEUSTIGMA_g4365.t1 [Chlamydomonas eustigma]|eukprot:GAX76919.1 hypothetical protein CEUSTIGMA_g4365.t1 [Chlamydomonas eustigma]
MFILSWFICGARPAGHVTQPSESSDSEQFSDSYQKQVTIENTNDNGSSLSHDFPRSSSSNDANEQPDGEIVISSVIVDYVRCSNKYATKRHSSVSHESFATEQTASPNTKEMEFITRSVEHQLDMTGQTTDAQSCRVTCPPKSIDIKKEEDSVAFANRVTKLLSDNKTVNPIPYIEVSSGRKSLQLGSTDRRRRLHLNGKTPGRLSLQIGMQKTSYDVVPLEPPGLVVEAVATQHLAYQQSGNGRRYRSADIVMSRSPPLLNCLDTPSSFKAAPPRFASTGMGSSSPISDCGDYERGHRGNSSSGGEHGMTGRRSSSMCRYRGTQLRSNPLCRTSVVSDADRIVRVLDMITSGRIYQDDESAFQDSAPDATLVKAPPLHIMDVAMHSPTSTRRSGEVTTKSAWPSLV